MSLSVRIRLSVMMFLQYFMWGAWFVTMGTYLRVAQNYEGSERGWCYAAIPIAGMISPFFVGIFADRFFAAERVLATLHLIGAGLMYYMSTEPTKAVFFPVLLAYALCFMPTLSLSNTVAFHSMKDPAKEFPGIRVLGTIGWIAAGMLVGKLRLDPSGSLTFSLGEKADALAKLTSIEPTVLPMKIAAISSFVLALSCLFLPHAPPNKQSSVSLGSIIGVDALKLMKSVSFSVFVIGSFLVCIPLQFYYAFTNDFLNAVGMKDAAFKMTFGQISEIFFMLVMPLFFVRLGVKYMLLVGMLAWTIRYVCFSLGADPAFYSAPAGAAGPALLIGILLHGICYDFFFVTGQIYVDQKAPREMRGAAQGFIAFVTLGVGSFIGSYISGNILDFFQTKPPPDPTYDWAKFWLFPAAGALGVMLIFAALFNDREAAKSTGGSPETTA